MISPVDILVDIKQALVEYKLTPCEVAQDFIKAAHGELRGSYNAEWLSQLSMQEVMAIMDRSIQLAKAALGGGE